MIFQSSGSSFKKKFFPKELKELFLTLLKFGMGILLCGVVFFMITSLMTYTPFDSSINSASSYPLQNKGGPLGALFSDFCFQWFGNASWLIPIFISRWAIAYFQTFHPQKIFLQILCVFFAASLIGITHHPEGGALGLLWVSICQSLSLYHPDYSVYRQIMAVMGWMFFAFLFIKAMGVSFKTLLRSLLAFLDHKPSTVKSKPFSHETFDNTFSDKRMSFHHNVSPLHMAGSQEEEEDNVINLFPEQDDELVEEKAPKKKRSLFSRINKSKEEEVPFGVPVEETTFTKKTSSDASKMFQKTFDNAGDDDYELPPLDLLSPPTTKNKQTISSEQYQAIASELEQVLLEFGVKGEIVKISPGPVVTLYQLKPAPGTKTSRVMALADDIARSMSAVSSRISVIPGQNVIGIELPNSIRETVYLRELLSHESYTKFSSPLALSLGKDIGGTPMVVDLARMPHLLVAGTTGSGKSVAVNAMILSLLYRLSPKQCKFIMIDPKMLELSVYDDIPHLLTPVVTDPKKAIVALKWAVRQMETRYRAMSKLGVRNIDGYNARLREANGEVLTRRVQTGFDPDSGKPIYETQAIDMEEFPYIVIVVDEMADLMLVAGKEIEAAVQRLAQMARAAGIHLIMATQRPSVDVITGTIKANFPTRMSFQVTSKIDSRTILGEQGAEQLLGQGDMLYMAAGGKVVRIHGPFVSDKEVDQIVNYVKSQGEPSYIDEVTQDDSEESTLNGPSSGMSGGDDALYQKAVELIMREGKASTSFVQRHLRIGYNTAARLIEQMEKNGLITEPNHVGRREIIR